MARLKLCRDTNRLLSQTDKRQPQILRFAQDDNSTTIHCGRRALIQISIIVGIAAHRHHERQPEAPDKLC